MKIGGVMNQNKVSEFIKEVRKKDNLTQEKFAEKYSVTYQAVSKWETGKNIPDITILKQICNDYATNINDLLDGNKPKKSKKYLVIVIALILLIGIMLFILFKNSDFKIKKISANCDNFKLYGVVAYNNSKTSVQISNITYCGEKDNNLYNKIECVLYEKVGNTKKEVKTFNYDSEGILLNDYLESISFNIDHYSKTCKMHNDDVLSLEIKATNKNVTNVYSIPLKMEKC